MTRVLVGSFLIALALLVYRGLTSPMMDLWVLSRIADGIGNGRGGICECALADWPPWPAEWGQAPVVFGGRVVEVPDEPESISMQLPREIARDVEAREDWRAQLEADLFEMNATLFQVDRVWKAGEAADLFEPDGVAVVYADACPPAFELGRRYLVVAGQRVNSPTDDVTPDLALFTNACMLSRPWRTRDDLLMRLGFGAPPDPPLTVPSQLRGLGNVTILLLGLLWIARPWWVQRLRNGGDLESAGA